jgi:hypothetical protein
MREALMNNFPEGTVLIEIQGLYDGWSVARLPDGTLINRWDVDDYRYAATQKWINENKGESK